MKRSRKVVCWMVSVIALCWPLSEALAEQSAKKNSDGNPAVVLSVQSGTLSAMIKDAPLRQVLDALAQQVPLKVYYSDTVAEQKITETFERLALEEGIRRILKNTSHVLSYSEAVPADDGRASVRKMEIRIATSDTGTVNSTRQAVSVATQGDEDRARLLKELIHKALHGAEPKDRVAALKALKQGFQEVEILPTFVDAIKDKDGTVRKLALSLVAVAKESVPMNPMAEIALNGKEDSKIRWQALAYVGARYLGENMGVLEKALDDPDKIISNMARHYQKMIARGLTYQDLQRIAQEEEEKEKELEEQEREKQESEGQESARQSLEQTEQTH